MKKRGMISVIAASLLTATVVFTGCGGGGSAGTASSSSSSSTSSSSSSTPTIKTVKVSDGYVLQANVACGNKSAVSTTNPGEYEFTGSCDANIVAQGGFDDTNANGTVDVGEPKAPTMAAPATFSNVNPYSTLLVHGMTVAEVAQALGLPVDTNFDVAIPEASDTVRRKAYLLAVVLSAVQSQERAATTQSVRDGAFPAFGESISSTSSNTSTSTSSMSSTVSSGEENTGAFPSLGEQTSSSSNTSSSEASSSSEANNESSSNSSEETSSSSTGVTIKTMEDLINAFKSGQTISDVFAALGLSDAMNAIEGATSADEAAAKAAQYMKMFNGYYTGSNEISGGAGSSETNSSSSEATSSSEESSSSECIPLPATPCTPNSNVSSSSSETSSSSEASSSSSEASSSSSEANSSSSEANSSSSEASSSTGGAFPSFGG